MMKLIKSKMKSNLLRFMLCFGMFLSLSAFNRKQAYSEPIYLDKSINDATYQELVDIDYIGHKTATEIIINVPIENEQELIDLRYVDEKRLARLKDAGYTME